MAVRRVVWILILGGTLAGCSVSSERRALGYGDYVALSCDQLAQEAVRLMRTAADRSEHMLESDRERRSTALLQLKAVKQARAYKQC
jgi:hypothetical protein